MLLAYTRKLYTISSRGRGTIHELSHGLDACFQKTRFSLSRKRWFFLKSSRGGWMAHFQRSGDGFSWDLSSVAHNQQRHLSIQEQADPETAWKTLPSGRKFYTRYLISLRNRELRWCLRQVTWECFDGRLATHYLWTGKGIWITAHSNISSVTFVSTRRVMHAQCFDSPRNGKNATRCDDFELWKMPSP